MIAVPFLSHAHSIPNSHYPRAFHRGVDADVAVVVAVGGAEDFGVVGEAVVGEGTEGLSRERRSSAKTIALSRLSTARMNSTWWALRWRVIGVVRPAGRPMQE
jgi:hypothetical protein